MDNAVIDLLDDTNKIVGGGTAGILVNNVGSVTIDKSLTVGATATGTITLNGADVFTVPQNDARYLRSTGADQYIQANWTWFADSSTHKAVGFGTDGGPQAKF